MIPLQLHRFSAWRQILAAANRNRSRPYSFTHLTLDRKNLLKHIYARRSQKPPKGRLRWQLNDLQYPGENWIPGDETQMVQPRKAHPCARVQLEVGVSNSPPLLERIGLKNKNATDFTDSKSLPPSYLTGGPST